MSEYENNPRYEKLPDGTYLDHATDEIVFPMSEAEGKSFMEVYQEYMKEQNVQTD